MTHTYPTSFNQWFNSHRPFTGAALQFAKQEQPGHIEFVLAWKGYEQLSMPVLFQVLNKQYHTVRDADESYHKHKEKVVIHTLFNTAEIAWDVIKYNRLGKHPREVFGKSYEMAENDVNLPWCGRTIYSRQNPPQDWINEFGEEQGWNMAREWNKDQRRSVKFLTNYYNQLLTALETYLPGIMPQLLCMSPDWWKLYRFELLHICHMWKDSLDTMEHMIGYKMHGDWLDKPILEQSEELDRIHHEEWHRKYGKK
jgi:hypothetical protein